MVKAAPKAPKTAPPAVAEPVEAPAAPCPKDLEGRPLTGVGSWRWRRLFLWVVNIFCGWVIVYCLVERLESRVAETAVMMAFGVMAASVGAYVFGAVWDDRNKMDLLGTQPGDDVVDRPLR
jgi:hypothetical protein